MSTLAAAGRRYLLDSNILSDLIRNPQGAAAQRLINEGDASVCTSVVVACELRYGARKRQSARLTAQLDAVLRNIDVLALEPDVDLHYADIRTALEAVGQPIGANDLLIAAHTRCLGLTLVTDNEREFARVPQLPVVNWVRP